MLQPTLPSSLARSLIGMSYIKLIRWAHGEGKREPSERHSAHQKPGAIPSRSRAFESMPVHRSTIPEAATLKGGSVALQQKQIEFTECMYVYLTIKIVAESISIAGVPAAVAACD